MIGKAARKEADEHIRAWGTELGDDAWRLLDKYVADVLQYNRRTNITAAKDADTILRRHVVDGLAPAAAMKARINAPHPRLLDVGAGAGFTGFGMKIAWPEADVTLMESSYRKFCFLNLASANLGLRGLHVVQERAGQNTPGGYDAVLARAVAPLPDAAALTLGLTRPGGFAVVYQSEEPQLNEVLSESLDNAGGTLSDRVPYRLPGETSDRFLAIFRRNE